MNKLLFIIIFFIAPELCFSQKKVGTPKQELEILVDSIHETRSSDRASAIKFCLKAEILAKEIDDFETLDEIYYTLGSIYVWIDHKKSIEYSRIGISLSQTLENRNGSAKYYVLLGKIAASTEDPDTAIRLYSSADSIYTTDKDTYNLAWVKGALGHAYMEKSEYIKAIDLLSLSIKLNESIGLKEKTIVALVNLGNCRLELNQPDLAVTQLEEAYSLAEKLGDNYGKAIAGLVFSKFHQTFGRYSLAINFAQEAVEIAKQSENYYLLKKAYNELQELFKEAGDYKQSLTFLEFYHAAADTLENRKNDVLIADMQNAIAIKKQSFENELLKKEKSRLVYKQRAQSSQNKLLAILLISSCLILAILAILVILRNKSSKLKRKLDEETIKMKNREITNLSIYIKQRSLFINLIRNDLKKIRETDNDSTKNSLLTEVFVKVGQYARIDNDSGLIKEHIEESSQDFIARLDKVYPTLTKKEKRLAQLLRMKLSSKEIALLLDIAPHSVDISRYRLRKKLNLKKSEDLASCFANI